MEEVLVTVAGPAEQCVVWALEAEVHLWRLADVALGSQTHEHFGELVVVGVAYELEFSAVAEELILASQIILASGLILVHFTILNYQVWR